MYFHVNSETVDLYTQSVFDVDLLVLWIFVYQVMCDCCLFIYSFIYLYIYLFMYLCIYVFIYLFIYLFIYSFIHSFISQDAAKT